MIAPGGNETAAHKLYTSARRRQELARDGFNSHSLRSCRELTSQLTRVATTGEHPSKLIPWRGGKALQVIARGRERARAMAAGGGAPVGGALMAANALGAMAGNSLEVKWDARTVKATAERRSAAVRQEEGEEEEEGRTGGGPNMAQNVVDGGEAASRREASGGRRLGFWGWLKSRFGGSGQGGEEGGSEGRVAPARVGDPPLVFVLQSNPFAPSDTRDAWLSQLHREQNDEVWGGAEGAGAAKEVEGKGKEEEGGVGGGLLLVDDRDSLYGTMPCHRADDIHFFEPVKLVEGKMLWHLLALADRNGV